MNIHTIQTEGFRPKLQDRNGRRIRASGQIAGFGITRNVNVRTCGLVDVRDAASDELLADHMWVPIVGENWAAGFRVGDIIAFDATIGPYLKRHDDAPTAKLDFGFTDVAGAEIVRGRDE